MLNDWMLLSPQLQDWGERGLEGKGRLTREAKPFGNTEDLPKSLAAGSTLSGSHEFSF